MARPNLREQLARFRKRLQALAVERGIDLQIQTGTTERMVVELASRPYIVLIPSTSLELTPSRVEKRIHSWRQLRGKTAAGHIILAPSARLSRTVKYGYLESFPARVVVVGLWGTENEVAASHVDAEMGMILSAAGVPEAALQRAQRPSGLTYEIAADEPKVAADRAQSNPRVLRPGLQVDCYLLERRLGRGHSAEVWKAKLVKPIPGGELAVGTEVALKVYFQSMMQGFQTLRIQREFAVAAELRHPNLASVFDLVLSPSRPFHTFLAMEYVNGRSLKDHIEANGKLTWQQARVVAIQLFGALQEIHSLGALHRDVKAANIMVVSGAMVPLEIKLVDLGIVSIPSEDRFTAASVFLGSKHSAPLEQLTGGEVDERSDIYGAGSVLFHCLRGEPMYSNVGPEGAIVLRMRDRPDVLDLSGTATRINHEVSVFVNRCISVDRSQRPATAAECLSELGRLS